MCRILEKISRQVQICIVLVTIELRARINTRQKYYNILVVDSN